jgi:hypothetical protein
MRLYRLSVTFLLVGMLIVGAGVTAQATQTWVTDPATGCKIGYVHETATLLSASWSGPVVAGKAQGKGNLSLTIKGSDGKELQGQGQAEMRAGLLDGKAALKWADGSSYDGYYKTGLREGKCILKYANGDSYDGYYKADLKEGKGIYKQANGYSYDGEWKNGKMEGHGVLKDATGKITYEGEYKDGKPVTQTQPAQPKTAPTQSWVTDPATGCKIGWVHEQSTLISASWSGPIVAGKAQGKGNISLTLKDKDGKEVQGQGQATMLAGLLNGKVSIKWSDGNSYDGFYKAGLKEGKGIIKWANGGSYDGDWKADQFEGKGIVKSAEGWSYDGEWKAGLMEGKGIKKWPDGASYNGEWKNGTWEGMGSFKFPDGRVYTGGFKDSRFNGHGVLKDAAGKIIYEGEWKDDKMSVKTEKVLDIPWGASVDEAKRIMGQRPKTSYFGASTNANVKQHTWHTYIGYFNDDVARLQVHFYEGKMFGVDACVYTSEDQLLDKFNSIKQGLTQRYGPPAITVGKYLDTHVWWNLGGDYGVTMSIKKSTMFKDTPFEIIISYRNRATENAINKAGAPTSGKDY